MSEVKRTSRHAVPRRHPRALRSGMSVCLALAVISSFGYPVTSTIPSGSTAASSVGTDGANGSIFAQGSGIMADVKRPHTGYVGEQVLGQPSLHSPFGTTDSLVPGRSIPLPGEAARATGETVHVPGTMARPGKGTLIAPLQFLNPSSPFGIRTSPITGEHGEFHTGQDFAAPCGTRVFSADAGVVRAAGWHPWGGGNRVEVDHGNGLVTTYNHLEGIAVKTGDLVGAGQVIATVGTTGWSTGCHLHFETILNGEHTDPSAWKLIALDGSGPVDMPSLVNFTPGTGNGRSGETAWVAYLASPGASHPVAFKSPSRVDSEVSALGPRSTSRKTSASSEKLSSGSGKQPSSTIVAASPSPSASGTQTTKPAPKPSTSSGTATTTPPSSSTVTDPTPTPPPPSSTVTDPTPDPVVTDPAPPATEPTPTTDPGTSAQCDTTSPGTAEGPGATTESTTVDGTAGGTEPAGTAPEPAIDPVTGEPIPAEDPCAPATEPEAGATEPAP